MIPIIANESAGIEDSKGFERGSAVERSKGTGRRRVLTRIVQRNTKVEAFAFLEIGSMMMMPWASAHKRVADEYTDEHTQ